MPLPGIGSTSRLDGKEILRLWIELGTLNRVSNYLFERGQMTSGGKHFQHCYLAGPVNKWIVAHVDEAWEIYQKAGTPFTREQFNRWVIRVAMRSSVLGASTEKFMDWIAANHFEVYKELYERRFPNKPDGRWLEAR